jgi:type I restriction enzyme S subunit
MSENILPEKWKPGYIDDIAEINPKSSNKQISKNQVISFIPMEAVDESGRIVKELIAELKRVSKGYTYFLENDVLFAKITPCMENGKGCFVESLINHFGAGSTEFHVLRANDINYAKLIYQHTISHKLRLKALRFMTGSAGQQRVQSLFFSRYPINIPPSDEARKIAEVLTTIDNTIEKTEQLIEKLKNIKKGLMHDLFTRGVDENGQLRPSYEEAPHLYKESKLGWIPKEWEVDKLSDITTYVDYRGKTPEKSDTGLFLITAKNIKMGRIDYELSKEYIPAHTYKNVMSRGEVQIGDIVITTEAPCGNVAQIDIEGLALAQRVIKYRGKSSIQNTFLKYSLMSEYFQMQLFKEATGSTVLGIKGSRLHKQKILRPKCIEEQNKIICIFEIYDKKIKKQHFQLSKLKKIKQGLMEDLLTGKVRVSSLLEKEAANV